MTTYPTTNPYLRAAIDIVWINKNGIRNDFKKTAASLTPSYPYSNHRGTNNTNTQIPQISDVTLKGKGNSNNGMCFCWHTQNEYPKLSKEKHKEIKTMVYCIYSNIFSLDDEKILVNKILNNNKKSYLIQINFWK